MIGPATLSRSPWKSSHLLLRIDGRVGGRLVLDLIRMQMCCRDMKGGRRDRSQSQKTALKGQRVEAILC